MWSDARPSRRALLAGAGALAATAFVGGPSGARGRVPFGGRVSMRIPWPLGAVDPHRIDDGAAAILGDALFDTLYVVGDAGSIAPSLAEGEPEPDGANLRVTLRRGLRTAAGRTIEARDVAFSIARARGAGARAWLGDVPAPKFDGALALLFAGKDREKLSRALASPLVAVVSTAFAPERPDGTGPFAAEPRADALVLRRNANAARGPSFVDEIIVRAAPDLAASLRAFEGGEDDVGWLGSGLHEPRPGAKSFDAGAVAWAVLRTGRDAGEWDAPGIAQRLGDGIPPARLAYLALGAAWNPEPDDGWGGPPCELVVRDDAPWLMELARAVAASITRPAHAVVARPIPAAELVQRRAQRAFALAIDVVRPLSPGSIGAYVALATADNPATAAELVKHPPLGDPPARTLPRMLRVGILGEIRVQGGRMPDLSLAASVGGAGIDLGACVRARH